MAGACLKVAISVTPYELVAVWSRSGTVYCSLKTVAHHRYVGVG